MKKLLFGAVGVLLAVSIGLGGAAWALGGDLFLPAYPAVLGNDNSTEKITGRYLVEKAAELPVTVTVYGSSELRTFEIPTHPSNFFAGQRAGFQINLVGRGSCQSLIHALSIAACGDALSGTKVVLITSPQSYVEEGIAPDLFMANFSEEQYLALMRDPLIPQEMKDRFSARVDELFDEYAAATGTNRKVTASSLLAANHKNALLRTVLTPYTAVSGALTELKDRYTAAKLMRAIPKGDVPGNPEEIDWAAEEQKAVEAAKAATDNNDLGILNDYYNTYIGRKRDEQEGKDEDLSYSVSEEYGDLRLLLDVCALKGIEPLFVHVPLHGPWSDYTGFSAERRAEYYENVRAVVAEYPNVTMLDLTAKEYEQYYLCDIMHLGWKGWLDVDQALVDYFRAD